MENKITVFLDDQDKIWVCTMEMPEKPINNSGWDSKSYREREERYEKLLQSAKDSATEIQNKDEVRYWIRLIYDMPYEDIKQNHFYELKGYKYEVKEACSNDSCLVDGRCEHCAKFKNFAFVTPIEELEGKDAPTIKFKATKEKIEVINPFDPLSDYLSNLQETTSRLIPDILNTEEIKELKPVSEISKLKKENERLKLAISGKTFYDKIE